MKNQEAKFILGAYRPDGSDAGDATLAPALAQAERDPELRAWFEMQRGFDAALSAQLQAIAPPPGLREAILAGSRVSARQPGRHWWKNPVWLAAAAAIVLTATVTVSQRPRAGARRGGAELAALAVRDLELAHDHHVGFPTELASLQAQLASVRAPLATHLKLDPTELRQKNCRSIELGGRQVFEVCFQRDGTWYHVYVARRRDFAPGSLDPKALVQVRGEYASTTWADADQVYALVTQGGAQALRRVI